MENTTSSKRNDRGCKKSEACWCLHFGLGGTGDAGKFHVYFVIFVYLIVKDCGTKKCTFMWEISRSNKINNWIYVKNGIVKMFGCQERQVEEFHIWNGHLFRDVACD